MLELDDVTVDYRRGRHALRALEVTRLTVADGTVVGVVGETGSGKTTLAKAITGLVPLASGQVRMDGERLTGLRGRSLRALRSSGRIGYVHQDALGSLDPAWTVRRSLTEAPAGARPGAARLEQVLADLNLDRTLLDAHPSRLSGGQRQRAGLARVLVRDPRLVILDEPTSALDPVNRQAVLDLVRRRREAGTSALVISHDIASLLDVADRLAVMYRGRVVEENDTATVLAAPEHPYTRLLLASIPSLFAPGLTPAERRELRAAADLAAAAPVPPATR